jgi:heme/copper-type cytochrome/quinol oxidase subunit 2
MTTGAPDRRSRLHVVAAPPIADVEEQQPDRRGLMNLPPSDEHDEDDRRWTFLLALAAVVVIVVVGFLLVWKMWQNEQTQECLITGRRDCAPIDIPASH